MDYVASIVVPTFNTPRILFDKCIDSIFSQINNCIQVIIVDDGSNIEFGDYIDSLKKVYNNLTVIHQTNMGEGGARNTGIINASGKYVMFVDSDDIIPNGWIKSSIDIAENTNADIVCGKMKIIKQNAATETLNLEKPDLLVFDENQIAIIQSQQLLEKSSLIKGLDYIDAGVCSKLIRRSLIEDIFFPVGQVLSADQVFNHRILRRCKRFVLTNKLSYFYVSNGRSISHVYHKNAVSVMMNAMKSVEEELFDVADVKNAYYYHVLRELQRALQFAYFSDKAQLTMLQKIGFVKESFNNPIAHKARDNYIKIKGLTLKDRYFLFLVRHGYAVLYTLSNELRIFTKSLIKKY